VNALFEAGRGEPREVSPGAVHIPGWLSLDQQRALVEACREFGRGPVPYRAAKLPGGHEMSVRTLCLGWHWAPYKYTRTAEDVNGAHVLGFPPWLADWGRRALADAYGAPQEGNYEPGTYEPDTALINFYEDTAKMGMHQDKDERAGFPVVSLSVGDDCLFRFGNTETRTKPYTDIRLRSGDLFVFGGPARFAYHGVPRIYPGTADPECGLTGGRLNLTMRVTGLS
jgi:DNA oxidative demethylase